MVTKNLVFQVSIEPNGARTEGKKKFHYVKEIYDYSNHRAEQYAQKHNADYYCLRNDSWLGNQHAPAYHKLHIYNLFPEYDKIMVLDSDSIITKICPNIFTNETFSAMRDQSATSPSGIKSENKKKAQHNLNEDHIYFCTGTMLIDKRFYELTKDHWRQQLNKPQPQHDQSIFNILVNNHYGRINLLDKDWGHWHKKGKYINHITTRQGTKTFHVENFLQWENKTIKEIRKL